MIGNIGPGRSPGPDEWRPLRGRKTFDGTAGNGATGTYAIADVTGQVEIARAFFYCPDSLVVADALGLLVIGHANDTDLFVADVGAASNAIDTGEWYNPLAATWGATHGLYSLSGNEGDQPVGMSRNIIGTISTTAITGGSLDHFFWWRPLSSNGNLVLATGMTAI